MDLHNLRNWKTVIFSKSKRVGFISTLIARDVISLEFILKGFANRIISLVGNKMVINFCDGKEKIKAMPTSK